MEKIISALTGLLVLAGATCYANEPVSYGTPDISIDYNIDTGVEEAPPAPEEQTPVEEKKAKKLNKTVVIDTVYATKNGKPIKKYVLEKNIHLEPVEREGKSGYMVTVTIDYIKQWKVSSVYNVPIISKKSSSRFFEGDIDIDKL